MMKIVLSLLLGCFICGCEDRDVPRRPLVYSVYLDQEGEDVTHNRPVFVSFADFEDEPDNGGSELAAGDTPTLVPEYRYSSRLRVRVPADVISVHTCMVIGDRIRTYRVDRERLGENPRAPYPPDTNVGQIYAKPEVWNRRRATCDYGLYLVPPP